MGQEILGNTKSTIFSLYILIIIVSALMCLLHSNIILVTWTSVLLYRFSNVLNKFQPAFSFLCKIVPNRADEITLVKYIFLPNWIKTSELKCLYLVHQFSKRSRLSYNLIPKLKQNIINNGTHHKFVRRFILPQGTEFQKGTAKFITRNEVYRKVPNFHVKSIWKNKGCEIGVVQEHWLF